MENHNIQEQIEEWIRNNSTHEEDRIIFEEQDPTTLASNLIILLNKLGVR